MTPKPAAPGKGRLKRSCYALAILSLTRKIRLRAKINFTRYGSRNTAHVFSRTDDRSDELRELRATSKCTTNEIRDDLKSDRIGK